MAEVSRYDFISCRNCGRSVNAGQLTHCRNCGSRGCVHCLPDDCQPPAPAPGAEAAIEASLEDMLQNGLDPGEKCEVLRLAEGFEIRLYSAENGIWWERARHRAPTLSAALAALRGEAK